MSAEPEVQQQEKPAQPQQAVAPMGGLVAKFAARFGVEPGKMMATLKATCFKVKDGEATNEQMMALLIVADQYGLNPWTREIYAFPDSQRGIVPIVGVDGWCRLINEHPQFDGVEFRDGPVDKGVPEWIECTIHRKDRQHPTTTREYFAECKRNTGPWGSHPRRMLRHKALIQCGRIAFSFVGIFDEDEGERIVEGSHSTTGPAREPTVRQPLPKAAATPAATAPEPVAEGASSEPPPPQPAQPAAADKSKGKSIGKGAAETIRNHLKQAKVSEQDFCDAFSVRTLEELASSMLDDALLWIREHKPA